jgi:hypothetical protein
MEVERKIDFDGNGQIWGKMGGFSWKHLGKMGQNLSFSTMDHLKISPLSPRFPHFYPNQSLTVPISHINLHDIPPFRDVPVTLSHIFPIFMRTCWK